MLSVPHSHINLEGSQQSVLLLGARNNNGQDRGFLPLCVESNGEDKPKKKKSMIKRPKGE